MSLFKLLLQVLGVASKDYIEDKIENKIEDKIREAIPSAREARPTQSYSPRAQEVVEKEKTASEWEAYFREILSTEFPTFSVREKVAVPDLVGFVADEFQLYKTRPRQAYKAEWGQPYTFVLENSGIAKAVVMLGNGHSHDSNVKYLIARMYAKKLGIPYINFYTQMPNERGYVIGRIRKLLG